MKRYAYIVWSLCALVSCSGPSAEDYYTQGRSLRESGEPVAAMEAFIAATRVRSSEYSYKGRSYSNMATMCRMGERHDLAYALYERSAEQFLSGHDTMAYAYALNNMAWEQAVTGEKALASALADEALAACADERVADKIQETRAAACLYAEEYDSVLYYAQGVPAGTVYFDILRAQAFTFMENYDSALWYAERVVEETTNPRYLDDAYYILTQCDSTAASDAIRTLAARRADIQRSLERNNPDWTAAMLLAEESLRPSKSPMKRAVFALLACLFAIVLCGVLWIIMQLRRQRKQDLEQYCKVLRQSRDLRYELQLDDYAQFCAICNTHLSGIADKLEKRGLSEREIRICVLVLIGLSYAEIAEVLYRAESGIGKDKYVIAKRLGVSVRDLQTTLRHIAHEK